MIKLDDWLTFLAPNPFIKPGSEKMQLNGIVYGHPKLPDGHQIVTSEVVSIDLEKRIAKTISGSTYNLLTPNEEWIQFLRNTYGDKYNKLIFSN